MKIFGIYIFKSEGKGTLGILVRMISSYFYGQNDKGGINVKKKQGVSV